MTFLFRRISLQRAKISGRFSHADFRCRVGKEEEEEEEWKEEEEEEKEEWEEQKKEEQ